MNAASIVDYLSPKAKAVWAAVLIFLAQVAVFVGSGGVAAVAAITLGQWIQILIATSVAYGVTYNVPNTGARGSRDPAPTVVIHQSDPVAVEAFRMNADKPLA